MTGTTYVCEWRIKCAIHFKHNTVTRSTNRWEWYDLSGWSLLHDM